ncbi:hypothetical protein ACOME3_005386 [Neoechinorhynchus agilis]
MGSSHSYERAPTNAELDFMARALNISRAQVDQIYADFMAASRDGRMNIKEYRRFYARLNNYGCCSRPRRQLRAIADKSFKYLDRDHNGSLGFIEFMNGLILTESQYNIQPRDKVYFIIESTHGYMPQTIDSRELDILLSGLDDTYQCHNKEFVLRELQQQQGYSGSYSPTAVIDAISNSGYSQSMCSCPEFGGAGGSSSSDDCQ